MSKKTVKTNAMRILDTEKIDHKELSYPVSKDHVDGVSAAWVRTREQSIKPW